MQFNYAIGTTLKQWSQSVSVNNNGIANHTFSKRTPTLIWSCLFLPDEKSMSHSSEAKCSTVSTSSSSTIHSVECWAVLSPEDRWQGLQTRIGRVHLSKKAKKSPLKLPVGLSPCYSCSIRSIVNTKKALIVEFYIVATWWMFSNFPTKEQQTYFLHWFLTSLCCAVFLIRTLRWQRTYIMHSVWRVVVAGQ